MVHIPVNHPLRPIYRFLAGLAGLYVLVFGIVGLARTWGTGFFGRPPVYALGLRTNVAFSLLSIIVGLIVLGGTIYGRNLAHYINLGGGVVFLLAGMAMLTVLRTSANLLNFTVSTCIVSFVIGLVMFTAGLYGKVAPRRVAQAEEHFRQGGVDPTEHTWTTHGAPPARGEDPETRRFA
jgi:hypothetical protein